MGQRISRRDFIKAAGAVGLGSMLFGCTMFSKAPTPSTALPATTAPDAFTLIALPDTQFYSSSYPETFAAQTQWIADNKDRLNIVYVAHLGDVVDAGYDSTQWTHARRAMSRLDGLVPFGVAPGNHDLYLNPAEDSPNSTFVQLFGPGCPWFNGKGWYGGASSTGFSSWQKISIGGQALIFLNLDDGAKAEELAWGQTILDRHRGTPTIMVTHSYLNAAGVRHAQAYLHDPGRLSAQQMWDGLVRRNSQIFMVLCGHTHGQARQIAWNDAGLPVHELLSDYQMLDNGGNGFLRIMTFYPAANRIDVRTWSPTLQRDLRTSDTPGDGAFTLGVDFPARFRRWAGRETNRRLEVSRTS